MFKRFSRFLTSILIASVVACLVFGGKGLSQSRKSFLWKVQSKTSTLYLLGSIHFMKPVNYPLNPGIEKTFEQSDFLVVEADISDPSKLNSDRMLQSAIYSENDSIEKHLSAETYRYVKEETEKMGLPVELIVRQKPWVLALTLEGLELMKLGYDPAQGIDAHFLSKAQGKKKVLELEGVDQQLALLSNFSDKDQELFLLYTMKDLNLLSTQTDRLVKAWSTGDVEAIESLITKTIREDRRLEPIFKRLLDDRNRTMVAKIEDYLKSRETYFVVVGAGHLVGSKGIIQLLKDKGYSLQQL
jgi:uncharacterized protein